MIIQVEDIRNYREISLNTQKNRVEIFIRECEELDIVPAIGVDEYDRLNETKYADLTAEEQMLLDGGTWEDTCGKKRRFAGLKAAESYLVFSRFVCVHPAQVTPYGVVVKEGDDSQPASAQTIAAVSKDAEKIGRKHLADCVDYWQHIKNDCSCKAHGISAQKRKFTAIGD